MIFVACFIGTFILASFIGRNNNKSIILKALLLLLIIIDGYYFILFLVENIPAFINSIIAFLHTVTSTLDAVVLVALITGGITLLNSFYSKYSESKNKRREYLASKRETPYSEFIELVNKVSQQGNNRCTYSEDDMLKDINSFNSKLILWGSPNVVQKWNTFRKNSVQNNSENKPENTLVLIEDVMNEMRKDLGVKPVKKGRLLSIFINDIEKVIGKD